jgi:hypothetical protein
MIHRIDADDIIVFANEAWRAFADANGAPQLAGLATNRSLWDYVLGMETQTLWRMIVTRARDGHDVSFPYRCDSPGQRRQFTMNVRPLDFGGVEFASTVASVVDRDPVALLGAHYGRGRPVRCCSWCRRFQADGFVEVEEAIVRLGLFEQDHVSITHTICDACNEVLLESLEAAPPVV